METTWSRWPLVGCAACFITWNGLLRFKFYLALTREKGRLCDFFPKPIYYSNRYWGVCILDQCGRLARFLDMRIASSNEACLDVTDERTKSGFPGTLLSYFAFIFALRSAMLITMLLACSWVTSFSGWAFFRPICLMGVSLAYSLSSLEFYKLWAACRISLEKYSSEVAAPGPCALV